MESDAHRVRDGGPLVLTDCLTGTGLAEIADFLAARRKVLH